MIVRRLVEAFGADHLQWRALTGVMLKSDFRGASGVSTGRSVGGGKAALAGSLVFYFLMGLYVAAIVGMAIGTSGTDATPFGHGQILLGGTVGVTAVALFVGMSVLIDFQTVVISAADYHILGHQPVSSRTYFLVKLTNVLVYTLVIGAVVGGVAIFPVLILAGPVAALGWVLAVAGVAVATTLAMICAYATLLRRVSPDRLRRALSFVHVLLVMLMFGAPLIVADVVEPVIEGALAQGGLTLPPWLAALPPAWFASLLALGAGEWSATYPFAAVAGAGCIALLFHYARSSLALSYAESLSQMTTASRPRAAAARRAEASGQPDEDRPRRWRLPPELSVVATLVRGQYRDDNQFRLGVLGLLPAFLLYFFLAMRDGPLADPFLNLGFDNRELWIVHVAAIGFPLGLMEYMFRSESFPAAWIFFSTPADRGRLVMNVGLCVTLFLIAPCLLVFFGVFAWSFANLWHAVAHALALGLIAHLAVHTVLLIAPRLPFSLPPRKGTQMGYLFGMIVFGMFIAFGLPFAQGLAYSRTPLTIAYIGMLAVAAILMPLAVRSGARARTERLEFLG